MNRIARSILFLLCAAGSVLFAQQAPTPPAKPPVAAPADPNKPTISQIQMVEFDDYDTHIQALIQSAQQALAPWQQKRQDLIQEIQAANPGWVWHEGQGPGDQARWQKIPPPAPPAPATTPVTPPAPATPPVKK